VGQTDKKFSARFARNIVCTPTLKITVHPLQLRLCFTVKSWLS